MKIYDKFDHFIFIDALPKLQHYDEDQAGYKKCKDEKTMIKTLTDKITKKNYNYKLTNIKDNLLTFEKGDRKLEYYMNTTVQDALNDRKIRKKINKAKWLHVNGFHPHEYGLNVGDLPNLLEYRAKIREL